MLLLCVLTAVIPSRGLHVNLCSCNGLLTGGACPCDDEDARGGCAGCHTSESGTCCERSDTEGDPSPCDDETCCHALGLDEFPPPADASPDFDEPGPGRASHGDGELQGFAISLGRRSVCVFGTGPPREHQLRRQSLERTSTVLLI